MSARGVSPTVLSTNDERTLQQIGHDDDALSFIEQLMGDGFIRSGHDFLKSRRGVSKAFIGASVLA
jgi:hypothetical protein